MIVPETMRQADKDIEGRKPISVSVVIPVRNEEMSLPTLIASLKEQTLLPTEIIIVDGGSSDGTVALARRLSKGDERFRIIEAGEATPGRGRNVGSAAANSEWIAYTDAGIRVERTWLERLVHEVECDASTEVVYGNYEPVTDSLFERAAAITYIMPKQKRPEGRLRDPSIASSLMRRYVWQQVGGFPDLRATEDLIFLERIAAQGFHVHWAPSAMVWWQLQPTLTGTYKRFILYSKHNVWAGRQRFWHYGIARQYMLASVFIVLALVHHWWWLAVPLIGLVARVTKSIWQHREGHGLFWLINPIQFLYVAIIMLAIDLATFVGWGQAVLFKSHRKPETHGATTERFDS